MDPLSFLQTHPEIITLPHPPSGILWCFQTPWGFQLLQRQHTGNWTYQYCNDLSGLPSNPPEQLLVGSLQQIEVMIILQKLQSTPELMNKGGGIMALEEITKEVAYRKSFNFGQWHIKTASYSLFNSPFQLPSGGNGSGGENQYEVWFFDEEAPRKNLDFGMVVDLLRQKKLIPDKETDDIVHQ